MAGKAWRKYIAELNNGKLVYTCNAENAVVVYFKHPGLYIYQYDREGNPNIPSLMKFLMSIRNCGMYIPYDGKDKYFCDWPSVQGGRLNFITSSILTISRALYKLEIDKKSLDTNLSLGNVGNTSCSNIVSINASESRVPLASLYIHFVTVDSVTRQPKTLPEWFRSKYKDLALQKTPLRVSTLSLPKETYHCQVQVTWSDTDSNDHTNYSSYVNYAINALRRALRLKDRAESEKSEIKEKDLISTDQAVRCLKGLTKEIVRNGLKTVKVCYTKESREGDVLDVHLWQEDGHDFAVLCVVVLDGNNVCHIQLEYFMTLSHL